MLSSPLGNMADSLGSTGDDVCACGHVCVSLGEWRGERTRSQPSSSQVDGESVVLSGEMEVAI